MLSLLEHFYENAEGYTTVLALVVIPLGLYVSFFLLRKVNELI